MTSRKLMILLMIQLVWGWLVMNGIKLTALTTPLLSKPKKN
jgi:hypothetical protein